MIIEQRLRRYRYTQPLRDFFQQVYLRPQDFIIPLFIHDKEGVESVPSLPFVKRYSIEECERAIERYKAEGFTAFMLFPVIKPALKNLACSEAFEEQGLIPRTLRAVKKKFPECLFIADIALDPYHSAGHDGLLDSHGQVDNDQTVQALSAQALLLAQCGADILAPSDMMDARVGSIRDALERRGLKQTLIAAYSAKYASCFYGPFRDAVGSKESLGSANKKSYQLAFDSPFQTPLELEADLNEGAEILIIKPAMSYLDILALASQTIKKPLWAYHVSGECALLYHGAQAGVFELKDALYEQYIAMKRAGAHKIISYLAPMALDFLLS